MAFRFLPFKPLAEILKGPMRGTLSPVSLTYDQSRGLRANRHMNPKFKNLRRLKVQTAVPMKYMLNTRKSIVEGYSQLIPNNRKLWSERDLFISSTSEVMEQYVPPENGGRAITEELKKKWADVGRYGKDKVAIRNIRKMEAEFNLKVFVDEAQEIYLKAHECLTMNDHEELGNYVTEHARTTMLHNSSLRTIRWKYLQALEEPKVVQVRYFQMDLGAYFAQITVRMLSQQTLAVYDRFGRLIYGSEILAKDVLEYVVFEKHLTAQYGTWRLHAKIIPSGSMQLAEQTYAIPRSSPQEPSTVMTQSKDTTP